MAMEKDGTVAGLSSDNYRPTMKKAPLIRFSEAEQTYVVDAKKGEFHAQFTFSQSNKGWKQTRTGGDQELDCMLREYISHESVSDLAEWWKLDFDTYSVARTEKSKDAGNAHSGKWGDY